MIALLFEFLMPKKKREEEIETCPICLDAYRKPIKLSCGHKFCASCISSWLPNLNFDVGTCPTCRVAVKVDDIDFENIDNVPRAVQFHALPTSYWASIPKTSTTQTNDLFETLKMHLPSSQQFTERLHRGATHGVTIELRWKQLDPRIRKATRQSIREDKKVKFVSLIVNYDPRGGSGLGVATADEDDGTGELQVINRYVNEPLESIFKPLLETSPEPFFLDNILSLRRIHSGLTCSVFDQRGPILNQVFSVTV